jgi:hypothetical protein
MMRCFANLPRTHEENHKPAPSKWRDLSPESRLMFYHFATRLRGTCYRFDLNLSPEIAAQAVSEGEKAAEFMHRRIAAQLKKALKTRPEFWFVMEEDNYHRLHIHGSVVIDETNRQIARTAIKKAGGTWIGSGTQFQLSMPPSALNPDLRGAGYAGKQLPWSSESRRELMAKYRGHRNVPNFQGRALSVTRQIRFDAEELYNQARQLVVDFRLETQIARVPNIGNSSNLAISSVSGLNGMAHSVDTHH